MAAKSIRTQEEAPEKEGPEQELHLDSTAEPNHRLDVLEKPYGTRVEGPAMQLQVLQLKPILTIKFLSRSISADKRIHTLRLLAQIRGTSDIKQPTTDKSSKFVKWRPPEFHPIHGPLPQP